MSGPRPRYRIGIVGTGGIAHAHAAALNSLAARVEIAGVVDLDHDRATAFANEFAVDHVYPDTAALFRSEDLDLVCVCTPPQTHTPLAIEAMRARGVTLQPDPPEKDGE